MTTGAFPGPLGHFVTQLDEVRAGDVPDMEQVGRLLVELAADEEFFGPLIAEMPADQAGGRWLVKPERGPRLVLFHRPDGVMAYTHSHHCWVAVAPVRGVETHQRWDALRHEDGRAAPGR
jgi:predicted metal-dependent enzyme (double-stranded beta helix superfamily)